MQNTTNTAAAKKRVPALLLALLLAATVFAPAAYALLPEPEDPQPQSQEQTPVTEAEPNTEPLPVTSITESEPEQPTTEPASTETTTTEPEPTTSESSLPAEDSTQHPEESSSESSQPEPETGASSDIPPASDSTASDTLELEYSGERFGAPLNEPLYDPQPESGEEVAELIVNFPVGGGPMEVGGFLLALPKWKRAIPREWLPKGWTQVQQEFRDNESFLYWRLNPIGEVPPGVEIASIQKARFVTPPPQPVGDIDIGNYFNIVTDNQNTLNTGVHPDYPNVAVITQSNTEQKGALWATEKLDLHHPFTFEMALYMGRDATQTKEEVHRLADGITFTLHNDDFDKRTNGLYGVNALAPSNKGINLGAYSYNETGTARQQYLRNALSLEFDTFYNSGDPNKPKEPHHRAHVALIQPSSTYYNTNAHSRLTKVEHFTPHEGWYILNATWEPDYDKNGQLIGKFSYKFSDYIDPIDGVNYYDDDIPYERTVYADTFYMVNVKNVFGEKALTEGVWWGFTGSTGGEKSLQAAALLNMPEQEVTKTVTSADGKNLHNGTAAPGDILTYRIKALWTRGAEANMGSRLTFEDELDDALAYVDGTAKIIYSIGGEEHTETVTPTINQTNPNKLDFAFETKQTLAAAGDFAVLEFKAVVRHHASGQTVTNTGHVRAAGGTRLTTNSVATKITGELTLNRVYQGDTAVTGTSNYGTSAKIQWPGENEYAPPFEIPANLPFSNEAPAPLPAGKEIAFTTLSAPEFTTTLPIQPLRVTAEKTTDVPVDPALELPVVKPGEEFTYTLRVKSHEYNISAEVNRPNNTIIATVQDVLPAEVEYLSCTGPQPATTTENGRTVLTWKDVEVPAHATGQALEIKVRVKAGNVDGVQEITNTMTAATLPGNSFYTTQSTATVCIDGTPATYKLTVHYKSLDGEDQAALNTALAAADIATNPRVVGKATEFAWPSFNPGNLHQRQAVYYTVNGGAEKYAMDEVLPLAQDTVVHVYYGSTMLRVSMPGKVFFYSLAQDEGEVLSPEHSIVNHSSLPVQVQMERLTTQGEVQGIGVNDEGLAFVPDAPLAVTGPDIDKALHLNMTVTTGAHSQTLPDQAFGLRPNTNLGLPMARLDGQDYATDYTRSSAAPNSTAVFTIGGRYAHAAGTYPSEAYRPLVGFTFHISTLPYGAADA